MSRIEELQEFIKAAEKFKGQELDFLRENVRLAIENEKLAKERDTAWKALREVENDDYRIAVGPLLSNITYIEKICGWEVEKRQLAFNVLQEIDGFDRSRGYPTGMEWMKIVNKVKAILPAVKGK